jgi:hypothetical protein
VAFLNKKIKKSTVLFCMAALLALMIGFQVQNVMTEVKQKNRVQVVALKDTLLLEPYQSIQESDLVLKEVAESSVHPDTLFSMENAVGKKVGTKILPSTVLRKGHLLIKDSLVGVLESLGNENLVATTIFLDPEQVHLGQVGDVITLQGIIRQGAETALMSIREVPILQKEDQIMTVAVTSEEADSLNHVLLSGGKIRIVLNQP